MCLKINVDKSKVSKRRRVNIINVVSADEGMKEGVTQRIHESMKIGRRGWKVMKEDNLLGSKTKAFCEKMVLNGGC